MSTATMNWALRQRLATSAQQGLLHVIADSTDVEGVTRHCTPEYMATHARMTRATMFRRLGELEQYGLLQRQKFFTERGDVVYEIRLHLDALVQIPIKSRAAPESEDEDSSDDTSPSGEQEGETQGQEMNVLPESQVETLESGDQSLTGAQVKSHSCDYHIDDPSLPKKESPPYPPPGGDLSKMELEARAKRDGLWEAFRQGYPSIARMDQGLAREELDALALDDAEWAISVLPALRKELAAPKAPAPRGAHLWLRKQMFRNFSRGKPEAAPPEPVWIAEGSEQDHALRFVRSLTGRLAAFVTVRDGHRGYFSAVAVGSDMLAMLVFAEQHSDRWGEANPAEWRELPRATQGWTAWQQAFRAWTGSNRTGRIGSDGAIRVPGPFPPSKEGKIYDWPEPGEAEPPEDDDADQS